MAVVSVPASGSVMPNDTCSLPSAAFGRKRRFCSSLPCLTIGSSPNSPTCTVVPALRAPPLPVTSSSSRAASWTPAPPPPYSSGMQMPIQPASAIVSWKSHGNSWSMSCRIQYSSVNPDIVLRRDVRISRSSSALSMSTTCRSHHRFLLMVIRVRAGREIASGRVNSSRTSVQRLRRLAADARVAASWER